MKQGSRSFVDIATTVAIFATCALLVYANWGKVRSPKATPPIPTTPVSIEGAMLKGDPHAQVVLIEWSDYECPYCAKSELEVLPAIEDQYIRTGKVQLAFYQHPLNYVHPHAEKASEAAVCAGRQGKFWEMHAALFKDQKHLEEPELLARARGIGLDEKPFTACLAGEAAALVRDDARHAEDLGLSGTPAFLIGRRQTDGQVKVMTVLIGAKSGDEFIKTLNVALGSGQTASGFSWFAGGAVVVAIAGLILAGIRRSRMRLGGLAAE